MQNQKLIKKKAKHKKSKKPPPPSPPKTLPKATTARKSPAKATQSPKPVKFDPGKIPSVTARK